MKSFVQTTEAGAAPDECAALLIEVVPAAMRRIRTEMRRQRGEALTVPQFRTLGAVSRRPGGSLSDVAEHIGLTLPTASKLVESLVERDLIARSDCPEDRRRVQLTLTGEGDELLTRARRETQARLSEALAGTSPEERATLAAGLGVLRDLLVPDPETRRTSERPAGEPEAAR